MAPADLGGVVVGHPDQPRRAADLVLAQAARIAAAVQVLVVLVHGVQPDRVGDAALAQQLHALVGVAAQLGADFRDEVQAAVGQLGVHAHGGDVHGQGGGDGRFPLGTGETDLIAEVDGHRGREQAVARGRVAHGQQADQAHAGVVVLVRQGNQLAGLGADGGLEGHQAGILQGVRVGVDQFAQADGKIGAIRLRGRLAEQGPAAQAGELRRIGDGRARAGHQHTGGGVQVPGQRLADQGVIQVGGA